MFALWVSPSDDIWSTIFICGSICDCLVFCLFGLRALPSLLFRCPLLCNAFVSSASVCLSVYISVVWGLRPPTTNLEMSPSRECVFEFAKEVEFKSLVIILRWRGWRSFISVSDFFFDSPMHPCTHPFTCTLIFKNQLSSLYLHTLLQTS